ncbi:rRNA maturation RNase YbeY [Actinomyces minihominis]|uniref:rRNA maturation RNase YbeY n=1 Tax=Actinomyces minihominis TaxID=2002838 RepID=UPI001A92AA29|nr:rRNA maturation RNase YbeY [Actinomyces minihominis]
MTVEVLNETDEEIDLAEFAELADYVLTQMHVSTDSELTILFIEEEPMADLHIRYLDLEGPTDVMSFPMDELKPGRPDAITPEGTLGDICICPTVARKQALAAGHSAVEEMLLLATHGILHLLGYDHAEPEEEEVMFALQRKLLLTFLSQR